MKHYIDTNNQLHGIGEASDIDGDQSFLVQDSWTLLTDAQLQDIVNPPLTLVQAQDIQTAALYASYNEGITQDIDYMSTVFQADSNSLMLMTQVLSIGSVPSDFYWRDKVNHNVYMTFTELQGLAREIQTRGLRYFSELHTLKDSVNSAKDIESVQAIVWNN